MYKYRRILTNRFGQPASSPMGRVLKGGPPPRVTTQSNYVTDPGANWGRAAQVPAPPVVGQETGFRLCDVVVPEPMEMTVLMEAPFVDVGAPQLNRGGRFRIAPAIGGIEQESRFFVRAVGTAITVKAQTLRVEFINITIGTPSIFARATVSPGAVRKSNLVGLFAAVTNAAAPFAQLDVPPFATAVRIANPDPDFIDANVQVFFENGSGQKLSQYLLAYYQNNFVPVPEAATRMVVENIAAGPPPTVIVDETDVVWIVER